MLPPEVTDPPVPKDGSCIVCGKQRGRPGLKRLYAVALDSDAFCSSQCARAWWGTSLPAPQRPESRAYVETLPRAG